MSKRNATLPCCADEISQSLQKELYLSLINNNHNKVHPVMFFSKKWFWSPSPLSLPPLHQAMGNDYDRRINKKFCPLPLSPPSSKISYRSPCALLNVNKVEIPMPPMWYFSFSIFKYRIGCSSLYLYLILCNVSHYFHLVHFMNYQVAYALSYRLKDWIFIWSVWFYLAENRI